MADGIESFSEKRNLARVTAGLSGGLYYNNLNTPKPMNFVDGVTGTWNEKLMGAPIKTSPILQVWNATRANGNLK